MVERLSQSFATEFGKEGEKRSEDVVESRVGESGALPYMGQIRSRQFLGKLLAVYAQENARLFLVWPTIVQRIELQNVCNRIGKKSRMCFASASETFF